MMDVNIIASCSPAVDVEGKSPGATSPCGEGSTLRLDSFMKLGPASSGQAPLHQGPQAGAEG